ncbi:hypothetical protein A2160_04635 [Candidatus Beckwithbacteria bacterium RBG_13_42_9]|uniref:ATP-grasp domain-containing protein n=1 Tax=Candidatus Beckwithbacteria bacterium RBG_13_42_9 TaxID=1797457 RepID=A0A1F5E462_9BACT|nr:MAG: hypothetical protein A2160_04635 [Candidatus Beckwithbacteria bacterium RBG_13_42_9]
MKTVELGTNKAMTTACEQPSHGPITVGSIPYWAAMPEVSPLPEPKKNTWGFAIPTCIIDTQSAPALVGVEAEQKYMRAFLMAGSADLVVTDFQLNQTYVHDYLSKILGFDLPQFMVVPSVGLSSLTNHLLSNPQALEGINEWLSRNNGQIQLFNVTQNEAKLALALGQPAFTCGDVQSAIEIGSKPGFKKLCLELGLAVPAGKICSTFTETQESVSEIMESGKTGFIKAKEGTGGTDLQSNIVFFPLELEASGLGLIDYVRGKLDAFGKLLGDEWVVEEMVDGQDGSIHVYIDPFSQPDTFVLGALTHDNSYVGGYFPYQTSPIECELIQKVNTKLVPALKAKGAIGFHCFDFKGEYFLEDNVRPGALDFIHQFVTRIAHKHFPGEPYSWYHCHVPNAGLYNFESIFAHFSQFLQPVSRGCFVAISNPEVLPYGRSIDMTAISVGSDNSVGEAQAHFYQISQLLHP